MKRKLCRLWLMMMVFLLAAQSGQAETLDLSVRGTITLELQDAETPVSGGVFWLYRVGDPVIRDNNLYFELTQAFRESAVSLDDLHLSGVADALFAYVEKHPELDGRVQTADANGRAEFRDVSCGLYLAVQKNAESDYAYEQISAFIISMPMYEAEKNAWNYNVVASPKLEIKPTPSPSPSPSPTPYSPPSDKLPQTGMLMWPIPVLGAAGIALFVLGWILCFSGKRHE